MAATAGTPAPPRERIASIDLLRGAVMILMAIDHVRVFAGVPAGGPTPGVFFTRWITHFCAPLFVFLAGTSAFLYGRRNTSLSRLLLTRGLWLVLLELTFLRFAWTFNADVTHAMAGVIWAIGWCMVLMAALVKLPVPVIGTIGLAIIMGHNLIDPYLGEVVPQLTSGSLSGLWKILYLGFLGGPIQFGGNGGPSLIVLYSIVPWIGVMASGYAFGAILGLEPARRNRLVLGIGLSLIALFLVLRGFNLYGDPRPWGTGAPGPRGGPAMPGLLAFLNTTKYPASFAFLAMTLGPSLALMPTLDRARGVVARWVTIFGRVPFFYYILHIPLIHLLALAVSIVRRGGIDPWLLTNHPMQNPPSPEGYMWSLWTLYLVWAIAIAILYPLCRWWVDLKSRRTDWWLRYL